MDADEAGKHLATIRRIMESATQLTVLPGKAAIIGGLLALAGCVVTYCLMGSFDFHVMKDFDQAGRLHVLAVWVAVAVLGLVVDVVLTNLAAKKHNRRPWTRLAQMGAYAVGPAVVAGVALTVALALCGQWQMVPGVWIMLYGGAIWMASVMSIRAPRLLGLGFFIAGILSLFWASPIALIMIALTFGLGHIVFGAYLLVKFGD